MKNQYFGDRRDLFKYDLLADLAGCVPDSRLVFIPMLTPDDDSGEGGLTGYSRYLEGLLCGSQGSSGSHT